MEFVFKENHVVCFDVDETLVLWDKRDDDTLIPFNNYGFTEYLEPYVPHINQLKDFHRNGWFVIVWSQGGWEWANEVVKTLGLENYVSLILAKPKFYYDDLDSSNWLGKPQFIKLGAKVPVASPTVAGDADE